MAFSLVFYCSLFKLYIITHIIFVNLFNNFHTFIIKFVYYKIIVLDDGKISGVGTHEELLENNEIYADVYNSQVKGDDDEYEVAK